MGSRTVVDSTKTTAKPGQRLTITATPAPNEAAAAHYYPAIYWYSMLKIPAADQFGGKSSIPARLTQNAWISAMKNTGCVGCHQLGQQSTRTVPAALGTFGLPLEGAGLLGLYSLGLGVPFVLAGVAVGPFLTFFEGFRRHLGTVEKVMGALLVLTGLLFLTGQFTRLSYWFLDTFPGLASFG